MLKNIPKIVSPQLLKILCEMGHGDEIVVCDANCPAYKYVKTVLRSDVKKASQLVEAILQLMPLDNYEDPVYMMEKVAGDEDILTDNWNEYYSIIKSHTNKNPLHMERFSFYEKMKNASLAVITADVRPYGNIILKKGTFGE